MRAILLHTRDAGGWRIAGLSVLERLIVAAHRAGCHPIQIVAAAELPRFRRVQALGIAWERRESAEPLPERALVAASHVLVTVEDLRRLLAGADGTARLTTADGRRLPVGVMEAGTLPSATPPEAGPSIRGGPVCAPITDRASCDLAEAALWRSLRSSSDGWVDRHVNRPVGRLLSRVLIHTPVTPNQVSVVSILIGIFSGFQFARGTPSSALLGAILLQLSAVIDCIDGDIARVVFKESRLGRWLDLVGDQFVHLAVFAGIPLGLYRQGLEAPWLALGLSCVVGVLLSFAAVVRGLSRPPDRRSGQLERLIDATTNRDFSVLLLVLAWWNALEWFVWTAAFGIHVFWILVVILQVRDTPAPHRPSPGEPASP